MKVRPVNLAGSISDGAPLSFHAAARTRRAPMSASLDLLARALPDLPQLGAALVLLVAYLAGAGSDFAVNPDTQATLQQAQEAAAAEVPGYRPF